MIVLLLSWNILLAVNAREWQNLQFSSQDSQNRFYLRTQLSPNTNTSNKLLHKTGTAVAEGELELYDSANSIYQKQIQGSAPRTYFGSKQISAADNIHMFPVFHSGAGLPSLAELSKISADAQNETSYSHLDIVADYVSFSDTKIYWAIQNRSGGFPTSSNFGTVYNSYMGVIADPASDPSDPNTIVWALNYMNVALGGISPGLYKITGTGTDDLIRIGNIESQIVSGSNLLIMSCNISDLLADADFAAWFNPSQPVLGSLTITSRTTVIPFATTQQDQSKAAKVYLQPLFYDPHPESSFSFVDPTFNHGSEGLFFSGVYSHPNGFFPYSVVAQTADPANNFSLYPQSQDFSQPVLFTSNNLNGILSETNQNTWRLTTNPAGETEIPGPWIPFSYIAALNAPAGVELQIIGENLQLSWQAVANSAAGTPVTGVYYRVQFSSNPSFEDYDELYSGPNTQVSIPLSDLQSHRFYRIRANKD